MNVKKMIDACKGIEMDDDEFKSHPTMSLVV